MIIYNEIEINSNAFIELSLTTIQNYQRQNNLKLLNDINVIVKNIESKPQYVQKLFIGTLNCIVQSIIDPRINEEYSIKTCVCLLLLCNYQYQLKSNGSFEIYHLVDNNRVKSLKKTNIPEILSYMQADRFIDVVLQFISNNLYYFPDSANNGVPFALVKNLQNLNIRDLNNNHYTYFVNLFFNILTTEKLFTFRGVSKYGDVDTISFNKISKIDFKKFNSVIERNNFCRKYCPNLFRYLNQYDRKVFKAIYQCVNVDYRSCELIELEDKHNNLFNIFYYIKMNMQLDNIKTKWMEFINTIKIIDNTFHNTFYSLNHKIDNTIKQELNYNSKCNDYKKSFNPVVIYNTPSLEVEELNQDIINNEVQYLMEVSKSFVEMNELNNNEVALDSFLAQFDRDFKITRIKLQEFCDDFLIDYNSNFKFKKDQLTFPKLIKIIKNNSIMVETSSYINTNGKQTTIKAYKFTKKEI